MTIDVARRYRSPQRQRKLRRQSLTYRVFHGSVEITHTVQKVDGRRHLARVLVRNADGKLYLDETGRVASRVVRGVTLRRGRQLG